MGISHHHRRQRDTGSQDFAFDVPFLIVRMLGQAVLPRNLVRTRSSKFCTECGSFSGPFRKIVKKIDFCEHIIPTTFFSWHSSVAISSIGSTVSARKTVDLKYGFGGPVYGRIILKYSCKSRKQVKSI